MSNMKNSDLFKAVINALYTTAARRTTHSFAIVVIDTIIKTLVERFVFLKHVRINIEGESVDFIDVGSDLNSVHPMKIGKSIETIVQVVYMDLKDKAGLYFMKEIERNAGEEVIQNLRECGVDLELLILQQNYLYRRQERKTKKGQDTKVKNGQQPLSNISLLGYTSKNISSTHYDPEKKICIVYDKNGKELDRLNLDTIIRNYIGILTKEGVIEPQEVYGIKEERERITITEKEFELLKMLHARDFDIETAIDILNVTEKQLNNMVRKLLTLEMLHYISDDEVALTDNGLNHLETKEKNIKK